MPSASSVLTCRHLWVRYRSGAEPVVCDVSLAIAAGERVALLGLNGSGKTSLLLACAGLLPSEGTIEVDGIALDRSSVEHIRTRTGFLFSSPADQILFPRVLDDVMFSLRRRGASGRTAQQAAMAALESIQAESLAERSSYELSHGQRLRVALAGALVGRPSLLLLDEPSAGLDPPGVRGLADILKRGQAAALIATHDTPFARMAAERFLVLDHGRIIADVTDADEASSLLERQSSQRCC